MSEHQDITAVKRINPRGQWRLTVIPDHEMPDHPGSMKKLEKLGAQIIPASVPGNFELDLMREGILKTDPYHGDEVLELRKYEDCHVCYSQSFDWNEEEKNAVLVLEGVDTIADVFVNGKFVGHCENMMIEHRFSVSDLKQGKNELFVHIRPSCLEARKYPSNLGEAGLKYSSESLYIRKAAHGFGWDIAPRVVSAGLWKPVYFELQGARRIEETYLIAETYDPDTKKGIVQFRYRTQIGKDRCMEYKISVEGQCGESRFYTEQELWFPAGKFKFEINDCRRWNLRGRGEQNLYRVKVKLIRNGDVVDTKTFRFGFRTVRLKNSEIFDENGHGEFRFIINEEPVFIMGTNWVPGDIFHSRDKEKIADGLKLAAECGCNAIRCWGGNVYENDLFFDLCDEYGFLVWQDFGMACGSYPQDERMCGLIRTEAESVIRRLRQHPCVCLWAGDNECDMMQLSTRDPNLNVLTRSVLLQTVAQNDGTRPYLPSSPYISEKACAAGNRFNTTEQHTWGPRNYFKSDYYVKNNACFASEMGYHGCPSPESVKKFIDPEFWWPPEKNNQWILHSVSPECPDGDYAYRIPLMTRQVEYLFGKRAENLDDFAAMSQIAQGEGNKYLIEKFRIRKGHTGGYMWWNIIDCWPEFSDAVVDYYYVKKLAFSYIRLSQQQFCMMMDDRGGDIALYACSDYPWAVSASYRVIQVETREIVMHGAVELKKDEVKKAAVMKKPDQNSFFRIEWEFFGGAEEKMSGKGVNHYLSFCPPISYEWYRSCLKSMKEYRFYGFEERK